MDGAAAAAGAAGGAAAAVGGMSVGVGVSSSSVVVTVPQHHVCLSTPRCTWKKGTIAEYVSKARVFFDSLHQNITLFTGNPVNKVWVSDRTQGIWRDYHINLPPQNDILGAQLSPDRTVIAIRVSDKEVKLVSTVTGQVLTARSCRSPTRMISVHWLPDKSQTLLFVTNAGVELYTLLNDKLKHAKTAPYNVVYHWVLLELNLLLLVDARSVFQLFHMSATNLVKVCKFELDCKQTSVRPPINGQDFHREQISLVHVYGRMMVLFVNEQKAQMHVLALIPGTDEMEQTHVFDLHQPGSYEISVIDNVIVVHQSSHKVSMMFDLRTDPKAALAELRPIGPPSTPSNTVAYYDPIVAPPLPSPPSEFVPYQKWTFLSPRYLWESIGDQQQGHFWTLDLNLEAIALLWPQNKRAKLVDFLLKRSSPKAKLLIMQIILRLICLEPTQLSLVSRMFSTISRINYDQKAAQAGLLSAPPGTVVTPASPTPSSPRSTESLDCSYFLRGTSSQTDLMCDRLDVALLQSEVPTVALNVEGYMMISQLELFVYVFDRARQALPPSSIIPSLVECIRNVYRHHMRVDDALNDLLVSMLLADKRYFELHQFLQYHILSDSLVLANRLLEISDTYVAAYQLALDMLYRLSAWPRLIHVLLEHKQVNAALRLMTPSQQIFDKPNFRPKDWLRVAMDTDHQSFYCAFEFFKQRNILVRNTHQFYLSDGCTAAVAAYEQLFVPPENRSSIESQEASETESDGDDGGDAANDSTQVQSESKLAASVSAGVSASAKGAAIDPNIMTTASAWLNPRLRARVAAMDAAADGVSGVSAADVGVLSSDAAALSAASAALADPLSVPFHGGPLAGLPAAAVRALFQDTIGDDYVDELDDPALLAYEAEHLPLPSSSTASSSTASSWSSSNENENENESDLSSARDASSSSLSSSSLSDVPDSARGDAGDDSGAVSGLGSLAPTVGDDELESRRESGNVEEAQAEVEQVEDGDDDDEEEEEDEDDAEIERIRSRQAAAAAAASSATSGRA